MLGTYLILFVWDIPYPINGGSVAAVIYQWYGIAVDTNNTRILPSLERQHHTYIILSPFPECHLLVYITHPGHWG